MTRPITLFTGQWADMPLEILCQKVSQAGYDGLELACWGDHFEVAKADAQYCTDKHKVLEKYGLKVHAISNHLVGQAICDNIDERHKMILPQYIWGDGEPEGIHQRAANEMIQTGRAAKLFGVDVVNGFSGSSIWYLIYSFPPVPPSMIEKGYQDFAQRWLQILDEFQKIDVKFALEVHPTEIAFDIVSAEKTLEALDYHPAFGFNYDPSHLAYQHVDYIKFIYQFSDRIFHVHMKDVNWSDIPKEAGVFGGHTEFGDHRRYWDFRSLGRGKINFEEIIRALNRINYTGPLSIEWEDSYMDRESGMAEACDFVKKLDFAPASKAFDSAFSENVEAS